MSKEANRILEFNGIPLCNRTDHIFLAFYAIDTACSEAESFEFDLKVHFIIKHKSPSGEIEEKHLKNPPLILQDTDTHVYTAILQPSDNT